MCVWREGGRLCVCVIRICLCGGGVCVIVNVCCEGAEGRACVGVGARLFRGWRAGLCVWRWRGWAGLCVLVFICKCVCI